MEFKEFLKGNFLAESSLSRVYSHFKSDREIGIMTAFRGEYDEEKNTKRNQELAKKVRAAGYGFIWVDGAWIENEGTENEKHVSEVSLMIIGDASDKNELKPLLLKWAKEYNQDGVVHKPGGQNKKTDILDKNGGNIVSLSGAKFDKVAENYTKLRRGSHAGRSFVLESAESVA